MSTRNRIINIIILALMLILTTNSASAVSIDLVNTDTLMPGKEGSIRIEMENNLDRDAKAVSLTLNFANTKFTPVGSSEKSIDEIEEGDRESFSFRIKAANDIKPGDYEIPYLLQYEAGSNPGIKSGSLGVKVTGNPELVFSVSSDNAIQNQNGKINFKIINKGFSEARFVSVKLVSEDFVLLSEEEIYIGTVDSDDFETVDFEVLFDRNPARFKAIVNYKDFDNKEKVENINLPLTIYSKEQALKLGIIKTNHSLVFLAAFVLVIAIVVFWRRAKQKRRLMKSMKKERNYNHD